MLSRPGGYLLRTPAPHLGSPPATSRRTQCEPSRQTDLRRPEVLGIAEITGPNRSRPKYSSASTPSASTRSIPPSVGRVAVVRESAVRPRLGHLGGRREVGAGVTRFQPGDEVYGMPFFPGPSGRMPSSSPHRHASWRRSRRASITSCRRTALGRSHRMARPGRRRPLNAGQRVLIHGGGGGVGHLAVQIAKARGAHVTVTASDSKR